jgi:hypothetical protein
VVFLSPGYCDGPTARSVLLVLPRPRRGLLVIARETPGNRWLWRSHLTCSCKRQGDSLRSQSSRVQRSAIDRSLLRRGYPTRPGIVQVQPAATAVVFLSPGYCDGPTARSVLLVVPRPRGGLQVIARETTGNRWLPRSHLTSSCERQGDSLRSQSSRVQRSAIDRSLLRRDYPTRPCGDRSGSTCWNGSVVFRSFHTVSAFVGLHVNACRTVSVKSFV